MEQTENLKKSMSSYEQTIADGLFRTMLPFEVKKIYSAEKQIDAIKVSTIGHNADPKIIDGMFSKHVINAYIYALHQCFKCEGCEKIERVPSLILACT